MPEYTYECIGADVDRSIAKAITLLERAQTARGQGQERRAYLALQSAQEILRKVTSASSHLVCITNPDEDVDADMALRLLRFNDILADLEKRILAQIDRIKSALHTLHKDADPYLCDYNFDFSITFWLDDADPACKEDDDNILAHFPYANTTSFYADTTHNYNEFFEHPTLGGQRHCWLFHNLCCHASPAISLGDILRIGEIWVTFEVEPQFMVRIDTRTQTASSVCAGYGHSLNLTDEARDTLDKECYTSAPARKKGHAVVSKANPSLEIMDKFAE